MSWNDLSMIDRAKYIQLGVQGGITNLNHIRDAYNYYAIGGDMSGYTPVDVTSPVPVYTEDETGNMYYVSNGKMTAVSSFKEGENLYKAELEKVRNERTQKVNNKVRVNNEDNYYKEKLEQTERQKRESAIRERDSFERAERTKQHHNHSYLANKSNDTIARESSRKNEIDSDKELIQNALEQASRPTFKGPAIAEAINRQEEDRKDKLHLSLNAMNAGTTIASLVVPELNVMNTIIGGAGVYQDIKDDNHIQTGLGILGMVAPLLKAWNPKWHRTRTSIESGRTVTRFDDVELGNSLFRSATAAGLSGDTYGTIVDDGIFRK